MAYIYMAGNGMKLPSPAKVPFCSACSYKIVLNSRPPGVLYLIAKEIAQAPLSLYAQFGQHGIKPRHIRAGAAEL
jgi:DNA-directed RNA polymerase subunit RPC12/RpoP